MSNASRKKNHKILIGQFSGTVVQLKNHIHVDIMSSIQDSMRAVPKFLSYISSKPVWQIESLSNLLYMFYVNHKLLKTRYLFSNKDPWFLCRKCHRLRSIWRTTGWWVELLNISSPAFHKGIVSPCSLRLGNKRTFNLNQDLF